MVLHNRTIMCYPREVYHPVSPMFSTVGVHRTQGVLITYGEVSLSTVGDVQFCGGASLNTEMLLRANKRHNQRESHWHSGPARV